MRPTHMNFIERAVRARATHAYQRLLPDDFRVALRRQLVLNRVARRLYDDYAELDAIEEALSRVAADPPSRPSPFRGEGEFGAVLNGRSTVGMTERVVEIPWVLSRYHGERRVLDIGPAYALPLYLQGLLRLQIAELHGVDLSPRRIPGIALTRADVRQMPFPNRWFDLILCVSTLEHIGRDNAHYGVAARTDVEEGDAAALTEMRRVLSATGRILVTVPFGRLDVQPWQKQYDLPTWEALLRRTKLRALETEWYGYGANGWHRVDRPQLLADHEYRGNGAPAATGLQCAVLVREDLED